jgi:Haem-binding domain
MAGRIVGGMAGFIARGRRALTRVLVVGVVAFGLLQLVPYGWQHPNPSPRGAPPWPTAEAEAQARSACYDCHSNETEWPWYSYVAPLSWLVRDDVDRGREALNFSDWGTDDADVDPGDAADAVEDGSMPPDRYVRLHPDVRLSDGERRALIAALEAMEDEDGGGGGRGGGGGDNSGRGSGGETG